MSRDLTSEEMDKLVQLQDMIHIDDLAVCRALLESKDWDLEATVRAHLGMPSAEDSSRPIRPPQVAPEVRVVRRRGVEPIQQQQGLVARFFSWGVYLVTLPVTFPLRLTVTLLQVK